MIFLFKQKFGSCSNLFREAGTIVNIRTIVLYCFTVNYVWSFWFQVKQKLRSLMREVSVDVLRMENRIIVCLSWCVYKKLTWLFVRAVVFRWWWWWWWTIVWRRSRPSGEEIINGYAWILSWTECWRWRRDVRQVSEGVNGDIYPRRRQGNPNRGRPHRRNPTAGPRWSHLSRRSGNYTTRLTRRRISE